MFENHFVLYRVGSVEIYLYFGKMRHVGAFAIAKIHFIIRTTKMF